MRAAFYTLGCKLNQCESEALASAFRSQGFSVVGHQEQADIYLVNTCTVTSKAEQKARRMIRRFSRMWPDGVVIITGCYVQLDADLLSDLGPNIYLVSQDDKDILLSLPEYLSEQGLSASDLPFSLGNFLRKSREEGHIQDPFAFNTDLFQYHSRAFLKIQDGCDNHCTYCRVTLARGDSRSLSLDKILDRLKILEGGGYREIVITGVNITSWKDGDIDFTNLITRITGQLKKSRIRISSLEPEAITPELGKAFSHSSICPHFHISVQSGSDSVLGRMRRKNNREKIVRGIGILRNSVENPFIAADIIVGFPGETVNEFGQTLELIEELKFSKLHVFPFSPRPGTVAFDMKNPVAERVTGERTLILRDLSKKLYEEYLVSFDSRVLKFLLEQRVGDSGNKVAETASPEMIWWGTSDNYLKLPVYLHSAFGENSYKKVNGSICTARIFRDNSGGFSAREITL